MRERVLSYIRRHALMRPGDRVGVAVSGGADSVALLRLLLEARADLGIVLSVVHFNHRIRGAESDADQHFVCRLAEGLDLQFHCDSADTPAYASSHQLSLEAAARALRYAFFDRLTADSTVHRVATAHTRDDQAETVLMRFLRGSGTRGLAGIYPAVGGWMMASVAVYKEGESAATLPQPTMPPAPRIVRPLLDVSRAELRAYLEQLGQAWREDQSNADVGFARNRLRHQVLPALRRLNPALDETLGQTAEIARAEEDYWTEQVRCLLPKLLKPSEIGEHAMAIGLELLLAQPLALQRRLLRAAAEQHGLQLEFHHVEQLLSLAGARAPSGAKAELPHGWEAVRRRQELWLRDRCQKLEEPLAYHLALPVPSTVEIAGRRIQAELVNGEALVRAKACAEPAGGVARALLQHDLAGKRLQVRNWHAGDRYWPAHTRGPKKLKELLQARHIPRERKPSWPVVVSGEEIIWVPGFAAPEQFRMRETDSEALLLQAVPLQPPAASK